MDKKKFGKICARVGTGLLVFSGTLVGGYALTPNKVRTVNLSFDNAVVEEEPSHFQQFVNKVTEYPNTGLNGLHADFDNFEISFKTSDEGALNNVKLDASLDLVIRSLSDLDLVLDANVDYNGRKLPLSVGYMDKTVYFGLKDLRLKCSSTGFDELGEVIEEFFVASVEGGGLGIDPLAKLESVVGDFFDNMDIGQLISKFTAGETSLNTTEEQLANGDWRFNLDVTMTKENEDPTNINIVIVTTEDHDIKRVDLGTITLGNITIKGAIDFEIKPLEIVKLDDPESPYYNANYTYTEIVSYKGWIKKLANLLADENQKMSLSFDLGLSNGGRVDALTQLTSNVTNIGHIKGDINLDASQLIDLSSWAAEDVDDYNEEDQPDFENMPSRNRRAPELDENKNENEEESLIDKVLNGIKLGLNLQIIGQNDVEYSNLSIAYLDNAGYIKFNEQEDEHGDKKSVIKAKVETETFNWILDEMPNEIKELTSDMDMSALSGLLTDITESDLITSVKAGDYSAILDVLEDLSNDSEKIYVVLNLSSLGLGNNAKVRLTLDSYDSAFDENYDPNHVEEHKVLDLEVENVELGDFNINLSLVNDDYQEVTIDDAESYDSLSFLPSVFDQVTGILKTKQSGFGIFASVLDKDNLGLKIYGDGQFDYGTKYGFGALTIDQYKYHANQVWYSHKIALDVDDKSTDRSLNNAKFIYGDVNGDNIKGRIDVQSVLDIVDVIKTFINDNKDNARFSKFIDPILELLGMGEVAEIIEAKDYFKFTDNSLLKEIKQYDNGQTLKILVGGEMLGLEGDIDIRVNFESLDNLVIDSLEVKDLVIGDAPEAGEEDARKTLNLKLTLKDFDEERESTVPSSISNNAFIDLSSLKFLLEYGLNTTELGYYNLRADIKLALGSLNINTFPIIFHIVVKQSYVKVYGVIEDVPNFSLLVQEHALTTDIKSEITFETYKDGDPNKTNDIGGYFSIRKTTDPWIGKTQVYNYRATSKFFVKGDNLLYYLLNGMLDIRASYIESDIGSFGSSSEEKEPGDYVHALTSTGFKYDENAKRWDVGINLGALTGISQLDTIEASIYAGTVNGKTYLTRLYAELSVKLGITLGVKADIKVQNIDPSKTDWDSSIQTAFNKINSYVYPSGKSVLDKLSSYVYKI